MKSVPREYGNHADFMEMVKESATKRAEKIGGALQAAFQQRLREERVLTVHLADIDVHELTDAIIQHPAILKPLVIAANVAARAIERDLGIKNVDTYNPRLTDRTAAAIAGYLKPFLPATVAVATLVALDRIEFIDKEVRAFKGRWEARVTDALTASAGIEFKKRKFMVDGEEFEIDAAHPRGGPIDQAVDIKRIEARRDIHKRIDEIVNKAGKLARHNPKARFGAVIYFPFEDQHPQIENRLRGPGIQVVAFAAESEESIASAARKVAAALRR